MAERDGFCPAYRVHSERFRNFFNHSVNFSAASNLSAPCRAEMRFGESRAVQIRMNWREFPVNARRSSGTATAPACWPVN
jgi:hypothetical protein